MRVGSAPIGNQPPRCRLKWLIVVLSIRMRYCDERGRVPWLAPKPDGDWALETRRLDLCGLKCPLPALRARRELARLSPGDVLVIEATDPLSAIDIPHLLRQTGDRLDMLEREGGVLRFVICRLPPHNAQTSR